MLVHTVFFWLKPGVTSAQAADFKKGVEALGAIRSVEKVYVGTPARVPARPVTDQSFAVGLTVLCRDGAAHDAYQDDPIHHAFIAKYKDLWQRVVVYDAE